MGKWIDKLKCFMGKHDLVMLKSKGVIGSDIVMKVLDERQTDLKLIEFYTENTIPEQTDIFINSFEDSDVLFCPDICSREGCNYITEKEIQETYDCVNIAIDMWINDITKKVNVAKKFDDLKKDSINGEL